MSSIFDMEDGDFLMKMSDKMMMDSEGHLMQSFGSGMEMAMRHGRTSDDNGRLRQFV